MAQIKLELPSKLVDGMLVKFKAPCDCTAVTGLAAYYPADDGTTASKNFTFRDSLGNDLTGLGNLFASGAYVAVVLNTANGYAYIQNAGTNKYLEAKIAAVANHTHTPESIGAAKAGHTHADYLPKAGGTVTGATAFSAGVTFGSTIVLGSGSYGTSLPAAGTAGRLFFKKV